MTDLSRFAAKSFDIVWHVHSLVYVRDATRVLSEIGRVLTSGGLYRMTAVHPVALRLHNTYDGRGWRPNISYFEDRPLLDEWRDGNRLIATTLDYGHRIETIVNGLANAGLVITRLREFSPPQHPFGDRGADGPLDSLLPTYLEIRARWAAIE